MLYDLTVIEKNEILDEVKKLKDDGYRLAAITCEQEQENLEFTYHFDINYIMKNIRIIFKISDKVESISPIYPAAFLMENEIQDLYGSKFNNLLVDYKGKLYLTSDGPKSPMLKEINTKGAK